MILAMVFFITKSRVSLDHGHLMFSFIVQCISVFPGPQGPTVEAASGVLITGDTLFIGSCGRTDLPGSDQVPFRPYSLTWPEGRGWAGLYGNQRKQAPEGGRGNLDHFSLSYPRAGGGGRGEQPPSSDGPLRLWKLL